MFRPATEAIAPALCLAVALAACGDPGEDADPSSAAPGPAIAVDSPEGTAAREGGSAESAATDDSLGPPLDQPERYYGLYANPERPDRSWFVAEARRPPYAEQAPEVPPGHLMLGAAFGDVAPWTLRTRSATEFEQAWSGSQAEPVRVEFELGPGGDAIAMTFTAGQLAGEGRLVRTGDLPPEWR